MSDPPPWRVTFHAGRQAAKMKVPHHEIFSCLDAPETNYSSPSDPEAMVASAGRITVPYNPLTREVITVFWRSHEWLEDRYTPPEDQLSGWVNLNAKQSVQLLESWKFVLKADKGMMALWHHPLDTENRLIPFTVPEKSTRANGKGSFRSAASAVGVSVNEFLKGPPANWDERMTIMAEADKALDMLTEAHDADPLGIKAKVGRDMLEKAAVDAEALMLRPSAFKAVLPELSTRAKEALEAITDEPLLVSEAAELLGWGNTTTKDTLRELFTRGLATRRAAEAHEVPRSSGQRGYFYMAGGSDTVIPERPFPMTAPAPAEAAAPIPEEPQEAPMSQPDRIVAIAQSVPEPVPATAKLFTATGTPWPTGGLLIQDEDGAFYVARKLVEEGR